jgi:hypothetical protein
MLVLYLTKAFSMCDTMISIQTSLKRFNNNKYSSLFKPHLLQRNTVNEHY